MKKTDDIGKVLSSPVKRLKLPLGERYWVTIRKGLSLGYYRGTVRDGGGAWHVRMTSGDPTAPEYLKHKLGPADTKEWPANKTFILSYDQARDAAKAWAAGRIAEEDGEAESGEYSVNDAVRDYLDYLAGKKGGLTHEQIEANKSEPDPEKQLKDNPSLARMRQSIAKHITPEAIGKIQLKALRYKHLDSWFSTLGGARKRRKGETDDQARQRAHSTANRAYTNLRSALNRAFKNGRIKVKPWQRIETHDDAEAPKVQYLSLDEVRALREQCSPDFALMLDAGLHLGARWGELCKLKVEDFDGSTVHIGPGKGKGRYQPLTDDGKEFFKAVCKGREKDEPMFLHTTGREKGEPWGHSQQTYHMVEACKAAKLKPIGFHCATRHSFASHLAKAKTPLHVIANLLGHAHNDVRLVTKHYAHLDADFVADQLQANMPSFK